MPRADVTKLLADSWHSLPHEDGRPRRLMHLSQFGQSDENKPRILKLCVDLAECVQFLLKENGYRISHEDDPKPADAEDYKTAHIRCGCGTHLIDLNVSADMIATLGPAAKQFVVAKLQTECPNHD